MFLGIWINPWCLDWQYGMSISQKFGPWHEWGASWSYELLILNPRFGLIQSDVFVRRWKLKSPAKQTEKKHGWCAWLHLFPCVWQVVHGAASHVFPMAPGFPHGARCANWPKIGDPLSTSPRAPWPSGRHGSNKKCWRNRVTNPPFFFCIDGIDPVEQVGLGRWDATIIYNLISYNMLSLSSFQFSPVHQSQKPSKPLRGYHFHVAWKGPRSASIAECGNRKRRSCNHVLLEKFGLWQNDGVEKHDINGICRG